ncbi:hypothetical protein RRG08_054838 [Elysia crispata]|uniref:Uncharacterized protein n=1 Tax=Elysia crispata TaxID=231223 RepID=A0AAE1DTX4_9GAST|nr:hypothetical protein RRG08_054838 [Elysia crispata]
MVVHCLSPSSSAINFIGYAEHCLYCVGCSLPAQSSRKNRYFGPSQPHADIVAQQTTSSRVTLVSPSTVLL